jgi:hypothetical protein
VRSGPTVLTVPRSASVGVKRCPCGYNGDPRRACSCAPGAIGRYQKQQSTGIQAEVTPIRFGKGEIAFSMGIGFAPTEPTGRAALVPTALTL